MLPHGTEAVVPVEWTDGGTARVTIYGRADSATRCAWPAATPRPARCWSAREPGSGRCTSRSSRRPGAAGPGPAQAARGGAVHRQRAHRAGRADRPRPDLGLQQLHDRRRGPQGRLPGLPAGHRARPPGRGAARDRGPAVAGRPDDHHRRRQHGRRAHVVKAALERLGTIRFRKVAMQPGMPQGFGTIAVAPARPGGNTPPALRRDTFDASECRARPGARAGADLHPARQPGQRYVSFQVFARPAIGRCRPTTAFPWSRSRPS